MIILGVRPGLVRVLCRAVPLAIADELVLVVALRIVPRLVLRIVDTVLAESDVPFTEEVPE